MWIEEQSGSSQWLRNWNGKKDEEIKERNDAVGNNSEKLNKSVEDYIEEPPHLRENFRDGKEKKKNSLSMTDFSHMI